MVEPFSGLLVSRLTNKLLDVAANRLQEDLLGSEEERTLRRAYQRAFLTMVTEMSEPLDRNIATELEPQLLDFVSDPEVAEALLDIGIEGKEPPITRLRDRFVDLGFDPETFPIDFDAAINNFALQLTEELNKEAARSHSPIFNQVVLTRLEALGERLRSDMAHRNQTGEVLSPYGSAPPPPSLFIGREDDIDHLKARLGITADDQPPTPVENFTAVRGWPGVGKTTLAAALAHDPDIQMAFPDHVLWASLGPSPSLISELAAWGRALGTDALSYVSTVEEASVRLSALLLNKRALLIVDDVWQPEHAIPFKVGGQDCAMLITTRLTSVAQELAPTASDIYKLAVLTDDKALELVRELAPAVVAQYPQECLDLVHELEGLPLALQVAGRLLRVEADYGLGVTKLLSELRKGAKLLEAKAPADRTDLASETTPTVAALLQTSTERLDPTDRKRFSYLGVMAPKPATFDLEAMKAVWQEPDPSATDTPDPIATVRKLVDRGLLEPVGSGRFQMHALLVLHAVSMLTTE